MAKKQFTVSVKQNPLALSFTRQFAIMQVSGDGYLLTLSYSLSDNPRARGRWGGSLVSLYTGNKLRDLPSAQARGLARAFFEGRPVSVL